MSHGYAEPKRLMLGSGDLYLNDVFVGNLKGPVTFSYKPTWAYQRPGNSIADVQAVRTVEEVTLAASVCDFKVSQLRKAMGLNQAIFSGSLNLRAQEQLKLSATANISTAHTMVAGSLKVTKLDRATAYVSATDYSATSTTVTRKTGGAITAGQYVIVEYDYSNSAANGLQAGGERTKPNEFTLEFVHQMSNGKLVQVTFYRAVVVTDLSVVFDEASTGNFTLHGFMAKALVDTTRINGVNMFEIVEEDPTTAS